MNDTMGKLPKIDSKQKALEEIYTIATDKRSHVLWSDACGWLELKMKVVAKFAKQGMKLKESK